MLAEHTLAAYRKAIAEGADAVECDTRLTADGVLVCVHDRRIDRTSDGRGPVSAKTYAELAERDFSSWKASEDLDEDQELRSGGLLTLGHLSNLFSKRDVRLISRLKPSTRFGTAGSLRTRSLTYCAVTTCCSRGPMAHAFG